MIKKLFKLTPPLDDQKIIALENFLNDLSKTVAQEEPAGIIKMYGGATAPTGWLICDGSAISRITYLALFTNIGTSFGSGDGSTTFNLPDFRGVFPKGAGTTTRAAGVDASGNAYAAVLGTYSTDKMQGHKHSAGFAGGIVSPFTVDTTNNGNQNLSAGAGANNGTFHIYEPIADAANGTPRTGHTTEPQSVGVNFIIKY